MQVLLPVTRTWIFGPFLEDVSTLPLRVSALTWAGVDSINISHWLGKGISSATTEASDIAQTRDRRQRSQNVRIIPSGCGIFYASIPTSKSRSVPLSAYMSVSFLLHFGFLHVLSTLLDEIAHLSLAFLLLPPSIISLRGRPAPANVSSDDCSICLGTGCDADGIESAEVLVNFCKSQNHVAHIGCMVAWYRSSRSRRKCPICRGPLIVEVVTAERVRSERGVLGSLGFFFQRIEWSSVLYRSLISTACAAGVYTTLVLKAALEEFSTTRSKAMKVTAAAATGNLK
ncbi:hypothetical protein SmJEL517_g02119 [Synchytrium microbalum]|uniref:RING-type domain-containing protein n=1 Tax=Synchytrium microbalum TaxID=1806994 RepID=A0A507C7N5_9FUNG|nr:uncharacterized protein SmJEL517_g02119 [Synchytrium microbalum]TPX35511.1 hypothetical protein SmJEL517_g02119 [Synchytrium microbalum]